MATDFTSFSRRSLISNESKYRQSLEYRMFLAENPDYQKNQTMGASPAQAQNGRNPYDNINETEIQYQQSPSLAQTLDLGPQKMLLNRERQFIQYAPDFRKPGLYDFQGINQENFSNNGSNNISENIKASTMDTRNRQPVAAGKSSSTRQSRWEPTAKVGANNAYYGDSNELNDRASLFSGNDFGVEQQQQLAGYRSAVPYRQALSVRPGEQPRTALISSAKMQLVGGQQQPPSATLHNTSAVLPENPLIGFSEGERQRKLYQEEFMKFALSQAPGSIRDVKERSRSKSRRARLEAQRLASEQQGESSSIVDIMNRTKAASFPNRLAMKQRYAYSRAGSIARSGSPDLTRDGERSIDMDQSILPGDTMILQQQPVNQNMNFGQRNMAQQAVQPRISDIGSDLTAPVDHIEQEHRRQDYKAMLEAQISEKNEKKRLAKQKDADEEVRLQNDYANHYHFGALRQGGGSPVRNRNGEIISQHIPFSSQSQHNGGREEGGQPGQHPPPKQAIAAVSSYGQQFGVTIDNNNQSSNNVNNVQLQDTLSSTYSPKKQEIQHMKPSNMFEDITEDEFNRREQDKKSYQNELFQQMQEASDKKKMEKERVRRQELEDDKKIHAALDQMREAFKKEEGGGMNQTNDASQFERDTQEEDRSILNQQQEPIQIQNESIHMPIPEFSPMQINVEPDYYGGHSPRFDTRVNAHDEQLQRLRKVQEEIEAKASQDRFETNKIFKDLIDSTNRMNYSLHQNNSPFSIRSNLPKISSVQMSSSPLDSNVSGNLRLESNFTRVQPNIAANISRFQAPSPIQRTEISEIASNNGISEIGAPSQSVAALTDNKSAIGRLDDLIEDFSKPVSFQGQQ